MNRPLLGDDPSRIPAANDPQVEELWMDVRGGRMRYLKAGPGANAAAVSAPLVMIHGLWGFSFSWRKNIPSLAQGRVVYAVDMLGAGYAERPQDPSSLDWSLRGHASRLLEFMQRLGVVSVDLVASSHGGAIAMMLARMCHDELIAPVTGGMQAPSSLSVKPVNIRKMVLVSPVNPWSRYHPSIVRLAENPLGRALVNMIQPLSGPICRWRLGKLYGVETRMTPDTPAAYAGPLNIPRSVHTQIGILRAWARDEDDLKTLLPEISAIPTLFIWGSEDRVIELNASSQLIKNFPNARVVIINSAGHIPYEELPDEFNQAVESFLSE